MSRNPIQGTEECARANEVAFLDAMMICQMIANAAFKGENDPIVALKLEEVGQRCADAMFMEFIELREHRQRTFGSAS